MKKKYFLFAVVMCVLFIFTSLYAFSYKSLTTKELPYKVKLTDDYNLILSSGFDNLEVIETYTIDIYSNSRKEIIFSETWNAKQSINKEQNLDESKLLINSEEKELYQDNIAKRFITVKFSWQNMDGNKPITDITYPKMY